MKKTLLILVAIILIVPNITFASWWNPLSWFEKKASPVPTLVANEVIRGEGFTIFYINTHGSRIRSCASVDCDVLAHFGLNTEIEVDSDMSYDNLPTWLEITFDDNKQGYIHKSTLSQEPIQLKIERRISDIKDASTVSTPSDDTQTMWLEKNLARLQSDGENFVAVDLLNFMHRNKLLITMDDGNFDIGLKLLRKEQEEENLIEEERERYWKEQERQLEDDLDKISDDYKERMREIDRIYSQPTYIPPVPVSVPKSIYTTEPIPDRRQQNRGYIQCGSGSGVTICDYRQ